MLYATETYHCWDMCEWIIIAIAIRKHAVHMPLGNKQEKERAMFKIVYLSATNTETIRIACAVEVKCMEWKPHKI